MVEDGDDLSMDSDTVDEPAEEERGDGEEAEGPGGVLGEWPGEE